MNGKYKQNIFFLFLLFALSFQISPVLGAIKDADVDGLIDTAEVDMYHTDPLVFDTDNDGRGDGDEILDGTDPLDPMSSELILLTRPDPGLLGSPEKFAWYIGRASGILAFVLLTGVVIFGLIISSRAFMKFVPGATAYETHRFISWLALGTVVLHFASFFFDNFMKMKIVEMFVPFIMTRNFQTALGYNVGLTVSLGVIAFYLLLILIFTSEFRSKIPPKVWRTLHYLSAISYILFLLHGFLTGTDSTEWWMKTLYATSLSIVFILVLIRIFSRNLIPSVRTWWKNKFSTTTLPPAE
ncbi:MAG: ferric reductase-like transmembrane domain-containing protein [Candidatus Moranbacteria bacterium]|nr:ferric reductase-like transmembrane domain-containing protein [Candidatus Moranbacteria bacterium]MDD3964539.1 ferric reductase-like transmembrane domain-containing protein [Candidatus Moranbacteria bacterium]